VIVRTREPFATRHNLMVRSQLPDASKLPSGENATLLTPSVCLPRIHTMSGRPCAKVGSTITHASQSHNQRLHQLTPTRPMPNRAISSFLPVCPRIAFTSMLFCFLRLSLDSCLYYIPFFGRLSRGQTGFLPNHSYSTPFLGICQGVGEGVREFGFCPLLQVPPTA
jgi:hypothetical protein